MRDAVDDFGFVGNSSTNNDAACATLQAFVDAGGAGDIVFPFNRSRNGTPVTTGAYKVTANNPIVIKNNYTRLVFEPGARINWQPTGPGICVKYENPSTTLENCGYENLEIRAPDAVDGQVGVYIHDARYCDFVKYTAAGFSGVESTALKVAGRDHLRFYRHYLQATRPLWLALNDREPTANGKDIDHSSWVHGYLRAVTAPDPCIYFDPGFVLRNAGFDGFAFVSGIIYWVDGLTIPRRESINFYVRNCRWEQLADSGPVDSSLFLIDIKKNPSFPLTDQELTNLMLAPSAGNDWSGFRALGVTRTTTRHVVYRGNGIAALGDGTIQSIQSYLEGL